MNASACIPCRVGGRLTSLSFAQCEKVCVLIMVKDVLDMSTVINCLQFSQALCPMYLAVIRTLVGSVLGGAACRGRPVPHWCKAGRAAQAWRSFQKHTVQSELLPLTH